MAVEHALTAIFFPFLHGPAQRRVRRTHATRAAAQAEMPMTARQQMWVPKVLLVARLFQALPRLTELRLAAPAAVVFAAIRFWCVAGSILLSGPSIESCSL